MSMICELFIVPAASARQVLGDPAKVHELYESLMGSGVGLSLEKSWHGLHFVLTGTAWEGVSPLNFLATGGATVGDEDVGYGPARILDPDGVAELDKALGAISDAEFARRFIPAALFDASLTLRVGIDTNPKRKRGHHRRPRSIPKSGPSRSMTCWTSTRATFRK